MKKYLNCILICIVCVSAMAAFLRSVRGQSVPTPIITVGIVNTTNVQVIVTNGVSWANYELYHRIALDDPAYPWTLRMVGSQGQTNFTTNMGVATLSFFQIGVGTNWDGDASPNWQDGNPVDASVGALTITIDSPVDG